MIFRKQKPFQYPVTFQYDALMKLERMLKSLKPWGTIYSEDDVLKLDVIKKYASLLRQQATKKDIITQIDQMMKVHIMLKVPLDVKTRWNFLSGRWLPIKKVTAAYDRIVWVSLEQ